MSSTTYQVLIKGKFAELSDEQRVALQAVASRHDVFSARFTEEGTVTYERALNGFTFRVLIPADEKDPEAVVHAMAEELCTAAVRRLGADCRNLQSVSTDRASIKINRKGR